jgi:DNA-directed RNA polymerase specialized sigma24 family protein
MPDEKGSISHWIDELKAGDEGAARLLWSRYFDGLVQVARAKLKESTSAAADEEDVALSAFKSLCLGAARGHFPNLENRDELWRLLVTITLRKALDQLQYERRKKRGSGRVLEVSALTCGEGSAEAADLDRFVGREPGPEFIAMLAERYRTLFERLHDDSLRRVAGLRMEGYTSEEIATQLGCNRRTVTRKLDMIRKVWQEHALL